ncbi:hypothetical protein Q7C18_15235 [Nesterenkonia sp. CL21]|uniref:hypothetical protein n=1 Tax=Nesterenkonia sp. CL21 TaxID=3064894 RepID=UPI002878EA1E|nr:hypothetical protein [Nesterenkonia sp. CL21]MDS2174057.1 hypothetical protein [Nesterenkonia sp. CL21]
MDELPEMRAPAAPYPYLRVGHLAAEPLPHGVGTAVDLDGLTPQDLERELRQGLDLVVLGAGAEQADGGPRLSADVLELLMVCEAEGIPTVLRIDAEPDLQGRLAAVVSHAVTTRPELHELMRRRLGIERALLLKPVIDPRQTLLEALDDPSGLATERIVERRELIASRSPEAQASRLLTFLGLPTVEEPLVTPLIVSRRAEHLRHAEANLARQRHRRLDPLLVIDPLFEDQAREETADWETPVRIITAGPRSTLADRLNIGIDQAAGRYVTVIEETATYGPWHITDLLQAAQHSGADLVGRASWFVKTDDGTVRVKSPKLQRTFGEAPALGTMMLATETARRLGFPRRAASIGPAFAQRVISTGGRIFSIHAHDMLMMRRGQSLGDLSQEDVLSSWLPNSSQP